MKVRALGFGCMRLSTLPDLDPDNGIRVIHAALDAGVTLLDTTDAYCLSDRDTGHNERLIAEALRRSLAGVPGVKLRVQHRDS